jgi:hypothetical protein
MSLYRASVLIATSSAVLSIAPGARAQSSQSAAQALFDTARELMTQERYGEACPKFEESNRLDPGIGTKFHLADCWQHMGRTASAYSLFREVESEAHTRDQPSRERVARDRATALEPFVSKLVIQPRDAASLPHVQVRRDGLEVDREHWNAAVPVDPGSHIVAVSAPGKEPWQTSVDVPPQGKIVTVEVPTLVDQGAVATAAPPVGPVSPAPAVVARPRAVEPPRLPPPAPRPGVAEPMPMTLTEVPHLENRGSGQRAVGWLFLGAGIAGVATAAYFSVVWIDKRNDANLHCVGQFCDPAGLQFRSDENDARVATIASASAGVGAMLLGAVLLGTAPGPRLVMRTASSLRVEPLVNPRGPNGLAVLGTW